MNDRPCGTFYDVIIAGAGPVGLFLAAELALGRCTVLVLEKEKSADSSLKQVPFGIRGLSAPTIEAFARRGLLRELEVPQRLRNPHMVAGTPARRQVGHFAGIPFHDSEVNISKWKYRLPSSHPTSLVSEMQELERVLARRAEAAGVDILRGIAVSGFEQTASGVHVQAGNTNFTGKWLVGCDGSRSIVRKVGNFEFAGTEPEFTGYSIKVDLADPSKLGTGRNITDKGMYLQSQPGYLVLQEFDAGARHQARESLTREQVQDVLRRVSGTDATVSALHTGTTWTDRARQATTYRKQRVLLAGDAAHIHAPLGGQGLNLGIGDAMNLGWKLVAVIRGDAPESLLNTYEAERHPIGVRVLNWSRAQVAVMRPDPAARALNAILRDVMNTADGATYFASRVWGVPTHYQAGDGHELVGHSCPNFEFENGSKLDDLMGDGRWVLLDFGAQDPLKDLAQTYSTSLRYVAGRAKESFGLTAALIRPDGYVAQVYCYAVDLRAIRQTLEYR